MEYCSSINNRRHSSSSSSSSSDADSSSSAVHRVLLLIQSDDPDLKLQAVKQIRRLTGASLSCRRQLGESIYPLVSMLRVTESIHESVLLALLNLAVKDDENKVIIVQAGALQPIISFLRSQSSTLQEYATAILLTLSGSATNKPIIGASGAIPVIIETLKDGCLQAKTDAVMALYNLSTHPDNLTIILDINPVPFIVNLLKTHKRTSKTAEKCTALLEYIVSYEQGRSALICEEDGLVSIVEVLEDGSVQGREHAVGVLLTVCERDRCKCKEIILREGVIPGLLELTVEGTEKSQSKARMLLELLRDSPYGSSELEPETPENIQIYISNGINDHSKCTLQITNALSHFPDTY